MNNEQTLSFIQQPAAVVEFFPMGWTSYQEMRRHRRQLLRQWARRWYTIPLYCSAIRYRA